MGIAVVERFRPLLPVITGKTTTRKRSARPACRRERHRARLPMVRIDVAAVSFIARTASTRS
jgi:hypothetical protein